ncbi:MAG: hydroxyethylthiazole kinase [Pseudomonadota bacterium]
MTDTATYPPAISPGSAGENALSIDRAAVAAAVDALQSTAPRVHALVSSVAQPFLANVAAALSVDISMTLDPVDVRAMVLRSDATLVNLGMFDRTRREAVESALATGCPFVLDPVKVERAPDRMAFARSVLAKGPRVVKGNAAEMAALGPPRTGVAVTTGVYDVIECADRRVVLKNGDVMLDRVIATGCLAGLLVAAMSCVARDPFVAAVAGVGLLNVAGEVAATTARGPGSFAVALIDAVATLDGATVARRLVGEDG